MTTSQYAGIEITGGGRGHPFRITMDGHDYSLADFCQYRGVPYNTVRRRMRNGQTLEKALALDMLARVKLPDGVPRRPSAYRIGEVVPLPAEADRNLAQILMNKRGMIAARSRSNGANHRDRAARRIMDSLAEAERLRTDPFERARTFLRRKGFVPVANIDRMEVVGRHRFETQGDVMDFARAKGWAG